jgi:predicted AAA+ superfamily ATPase
MLRRLANPLKTNSFLLFEVRGTGKSTLVRALLEAENPFIIDLLSPQQFEQAIFAPGELEAAIEAAVIQGRWIFVDEVQKAPRLLDLAQKYIDTHKARFALCISSARKLKR